MISFGESLRIHRQENTSLSIRGLAAELGLSASYLSKVERGLETPAPELIKKMAPLLKADADELLLLAGKVDPDLIAIIQRNPRAARAALMNLK